MPVSGVRLARTPDVDDVASVNVRSWQLRFADVIPADALAAMDAGDIAMVWASGILNPPTPGHRLLVAVDDNHVVGYAAIGPSQDPDADGETAELLALEVDPDHLRAAGMTEIVSWCPVHDEARRTFLQSAGWGPDSAFRDVVVGEGDDGTDLLVREVRLVASLT